MSVFAVGIRSAIAIEVAYFGRSIGCAASRDSSHGVRFLRGSACFGKRATPQIGLLAARIAPLDRHRNGRATRVIRVWNVTAGHCRRRWLLRAGFDRGQGDCHSNQDFHNTSGVRMAVRPPSHRPRHGLRLPYAQSQIAGWRPVLLSVVINIDLNGRSTSWVGSIRDLEKAKSDFDDRFYMFGHSSGAQFVSHYVVRHPPRVRSAIISAAAWPLFPTMDDVWPRDRTPRRSQRRWPGAMEDQPADVRPDPESFKVAAELPLLATSGLSIWKRSTTMTAKVATRI